MANSNANSGGLSFISLLGLLFIGLKLTGYISWSWLWVLSPLWIPLVLFLFAAFIAGVIGTISGWGDN